MSYAILRHGKIKNTSRGVVIAHNHRLGNVDQVNIDKDRKHLNRCFMGDGLADRIDALLPEKIRKDAVVSVELLLTSGPEFFDGIEADRVKLSTNPRFIQWVKKCLDWAKNEFGSNLVDATLHMDESTPHIHILTVPLTKDGRLCAKEVMARKELQRRQSEYADAVTGFGLKRGEPASETKRRHIGLKENPSSGGKTAYLEAQLAKAKADLARLQKLSKEWSDKDLAKVKDLETRLDVALKERGSLKTEVVKMDTYTKKLEADLAVGEAKLAAELVAKAEVIEALVKSGEKSEALLKTAIEHRDAAAKLMEFKEKFKISEAKVNALTTDNTLLKAELQSQQLDFIASHSDVKHIDPTRIDGMRLDAACGRLGVFSRHDSTKGRVQGLCIVPAAKVMPAVGRLFNARAVPGPDRGIDDDQEHQEHDRPMER